MESETARLPLDWFGFAFIAKCKDDAPLDSTQCCSVLVNSCTECVKVFFFLFSALCAFVSTIFRVF